MTNCHFWAFILRIFANGNNNTYDFRQEILSHGPDMEVLEPEDFREEIKKDVAQMYKNYGL